MAAVLVAGVVARAQTMGGTAEAAPVSERVTIDVKDTDIRRVLEAFSQQTGMSIVTGQDVTGTVSARLLDVEWDRALDAILKPNGYGYERSGDVIVVLPLAKLNELNSAQPLDSRVFKLRYRDAGDVAPVIETQLSSRGRVQIIEETGQKGWEFSAFGATGSGSQASRSATGASMSPRRSYKGTTDGRRSKSKTLVVTDIPAILDRVSSVIQQVDVRPDQILIEARFMEVSRDRLKDLGVDIGTGSSGATTAAVETVDLDKSGSGNVLFSGGAQSIGSLADPAAFAARSAGITEVNPFNTGLSLAFKKLSGTQFDILVHALEEDVHTNTLSAPSIMTLDNQEANILVGTQYPILTSSVAGTTSTTTVTSLDYYQDIGIQLRVVPQIAGDDSINMIVHPAVTSFTSTLAARAPGGTTLAEYPILNTREAETQILMKNGETILIGGLLKDVKVKSQHKVPFLGDIPVLGLAFQRNTNDVEKVELLIFITGHIAEGQQMVATHPPVFEPNEPGPDATVRWKVRVPTDQ
ncbi:MAG TPA: secretin and TonB N-terminal domain-containing protein [Opitutaceae bacterium]